MDISLHGTPPVGASVTSGTISTFSAVGAGDVTINTVAMPAMGAVASAAARCDQIVAAINSMQNVTGILAVKVTTTTFKLQASVAIVVAALGGTATLANTGLTAGTTALGAMSILDTRKQFGTNKTPSAQDVVKVGNGWMTVANALELGLLVVVNGNPVDGGFDDRAGIIEQTQAAQTPTRVDA